MGKAISRPQRSLLIGSVLFVYFLKLIILDSVPIGTFLSMTKCTLSEGSPCLSKNNGNFPSILYHMIISITGQKASLTADEPHIPTHSFFLLPLASHDRIPEASRNTPL